jgi:hypothetical protein
MPRPLFNAQTAREMALRSVEVRKAKALRFVPIAPQPLPSDQNSKETASLTYELFKDALSKLSNGSRIDPKDFDMITKGAERLWGIYAHAAGIPMPGHLRPERKSKRESAMIELMPEPLAAIEHQEPPAIADAAPAPGASPAPTTVPSSQA